MSYLDRIHAANSHDLGNFLPLSVSGIRVGCVKHAFAEILAHWPEVFRVEDCGVTLAADLDGDTVPAVERTCAVGEVLTSLPYAYATHVGLSTLEIGLGQDPVLLLLSCLGIAASLAIAWKVGVVAKALLEQRTGMGDEGDAACEDDPSRDASTVPLRQKRCSRVDTMRSVDSKASMSSEEC